MEKELIRVEQQLEFNKKNSHIKSLIDDKDSGYHFGNVDDVNLILKQNKIYIPESMRETTLNWYNHYLNHPGGDRLGNTIKETCSWKGSSSQAKKNVKTCKIYQRHKKFNITSTNFFNAK